MINFDNATDPIWNTVNTVKWEATCTDGGFPTNLGADSFEGEMDTIDPDKKTSTIRRDMKESTK